MTTHRVCSLGLVSLAAVEATIVPEFQVEEVAKGQDVSRWRKIFLSHYFKN